MRRPLTVLWILFACAATAGAQESEPVSTSTVAAPLVFSMDANWLAKARARLAAHDPKLDQALSLLRESADAALGANPFSVTFNAAVPPSGDKHDYQSLGPYWWPDPSKPDGLPYIRRDGQTNPETRGGISDEHQLIAMTRAVQTLGLAYWFSGDETYATRAALLLRAWFIDPATRMNPNLNFGQSIPGITEGRGIGIIETRRLIDALDGMQLMQGCKSWTADDRKGVEAWCREYLQWLQTSKNGKEEADAKNNHGTWYDFQVVSLARLTGQDDLARKTLEAVKSKRIAVQIEPDGRQPLELERTKALGYSCGNLEGLLLLARLGQGLNIDLWNYETADGRGIRKALDFLSPYADPGKPWPYKQIVDMNRHRLAPLLRQGWTAYHDPRYLKAVESFKGEYADADRINLIESGE